MPEGERTTRRRRETQDGDQSAPTQVSRPSDITPAATTITMSMVAKITTVTGMLVGTPRPTRSRAAANSAAPKASSAAGGKPRWRQAALPSGRPRSRPARGR